jgi:hypothetical protein
MLKLPNSPKATYNLVHFPKGVRSQDPTKQQEQGVCHTVALPFTLKSILRQKKNYGKFKYFTMQKYNLQKNPVKETKILQDIITL